MQQQRSDRLVAFLATLVTYPFMFLLTKRAAAVSAVQMAGVSGGMGIDTRKRLADFPEGAALLELERSVHGAAQLIAPGGRRLALSAHCQYSGCQLPHTLLTTGQCKAYVLTLASKWRRITAELQL
jgi:hypothetical protein